MAEVRLTEETVWDKKSPRPLEFVVNELLTQYITLHSFSLDRSQSGVLVLNPKTEQQADYCLAYASDEGKISALTLSLSEIERITLAREEGVKEPSNILYIAGWPTKGCEFRGDSSDRYDQEKYLFLLERLNSGSALKR